MRGKTCGVCGTGDGETKQEYQKPGGGVAISPQSFIQSWVFAGETCTDDCKLKREFVKLDKQVKLYGTDVKCYSTDPILQCMPNCKPSKTVPVKLGFHCIPTDTVVNLLDADFSQKCVDMYETREAHLACDCQC
ncbi:VIT2 protein, partial [Amia calva]|nr:VIT2 protein [Amia calva]